MVCAHCVCVCAHANVKQLPKPTPATRIRGASMHTHICSNRHTHTARERPRAGTHTLSHQCARQHGARCQRNKHWLQVNQLGVGAIIEPRCDGHRVGGVERVRRGGVVHDDDVIYRAAKQAQILDIAAHVEHAVRTKESMANKALRVQNIENGVRILWKARCEEHDLVVLAGELQESIHVWSLRDIHIVERSLDFNAHHKIGIRDRHKRAVDKGLIQVQHETSFAHISLFNGRKECLPNRRRESIKSSCRL